MPEMLSAFAEFDRLSSQALASTLKPSFPLHLHRERGNFAYLLLILHRPCQS